MLVLQTEGVDWTYLALGSILWPGILNTAENILVSLTAGNLLPIWLLSACREFLLSLHFLVLQGC